MLPVPSAGTPSAVLLLRQRKGNQPLAPAQLGLAVSLAEAAARALELPPTPSRNGRASSEVVTLDRRLREEFERARRYSLSFSLVLLAIEAIGDAGDRVANELRRDASASRFRQSLRRGGVRHPAARDRCRGRPPVHHPHARAAGRGPRRRADRRHRELSPSGRHSAGRPLRPGGGGAGARERWWEGEWAWRSDAASQRAFSQSAGSRATWFSPRISKCRCGP